MENTLSNKPTNGSTQHNNQGPITIHGQYIKDLSFENPNFLQRIQSTNEEAPSIHVNMETGVVNLDDHTYEVTIHTKIDAQSNEQQDFFIELSYAGLVSLSRGLDDSMIPIALMVQVPTLLFPFIRQIIGDVTVNGGLPPLYLAPVDFANLFMQQQKEEVDE